MILNEVIRIASKFDAKGFKQAETSAAKLERTVKNLGKGLGLALSISAVSAYGKAAVKAFAADDAAARSLGKTLENLGLNISMSSGVLNDYISNLEKSTGVLDDELRPAMDRYLRATMDVQKSQELLNLSLDIAAGTGKSLTQVSQSLQKAYLGQTQALGRLGVGLSKADLKASSFEDIQKRLSILFAGQASDAADSYQGQLNKLTVASNNAKEAIGKGLVDALITLSGDENINGVIHGIERITNAIVTATGAVAKFINVTNPFGKNGFKWTIPKTPMETAKAGGAAKDRLAIANAKKANALAKESNNLKAIDNANTKEKLAMTAGEKALAELKKLFDLEGIQIQAALNSATDKETVARLTGLKAINDVDGSLAIMALQAIKAAKATDDLANAMSTAAARLMNPTVVAPTGISFSGFTPKTAEESQYIGDVLASNAINRMDALDRANNAAYLAQAQLMAANNQNITITLDGQAFTSAVVSSVNQASASGTNLSYTQTAGR